MNEKVYGATAPAGYTSSLSQQRQTSYYDHKFEQASTVEPYIQRDHAWSQPEFDVSDEVQWANETIDQHAGNAYNHLGIYTQRMTCSNGRSVWSCGQCAQSECTGGQSTCSWGSNGCTGGGGNADPWYVYNNQEWS